MYSLASVNPFVCLPETTGTTNLFEVELPPISESKRTARELVPLERGGNVDWSVEYGFSVGQVQMQSPWLAGMLWETGMYSGYKMQAQMNYRPMNYDIHNSSHHSSDGEKTMPSLKSSLFSMAPQSSFDLGSPATLAFYQVDYGSIDSFDGGHPTSSGPLKYNNNWARFHSSTRNPKVVTPEAWKRLLELFGFKRCNDGTNEEVAEDTPVTIGDFWSFLSALKSCKTSSEEDFEAFLVEFGLDRVFRYNHHTTLERNLNDFQQLVRCLVAVRVGVIDGQHRMSMISSASSGFFEVDGYAWERSSRVKTHRQAWEEQSGDQNRVNTPLYAQTFRTMKIQVLALHSCAPFLHQCKQLLCFGGRITKAATTQVSVTVDTILSGLLEDMTVESVCGSGEARFVGSWFWRLPIDECVEKYNKLLARVHGIVFDYIQNRDMGFALATTLSKWDNFAQRNVTWKSFSGLNSKLIKGRGRSSVVGVSCAVAQLLTLLKNACSCEGGLEDIKKVTSGMTPRVANGQIDNDHKSILKSVQFLVEWGLVPVGIVADEMTRSAITDRLLLKAMRESDNDMQLNAILEDMKAGLTDKTCDLSAWKFTKEMLKSGRHKTISSAGLKPSADFTFKLTQAIRRELELDVLHTIAHYGHHPNLVDNRWITDEEQSTRKGKYQNKLLRTLLL